ncbi:MAG: ROK family protein [Lachnospiraceae bacterium]|nr:ROK family protein [Lachnospiraceae bacterium]
MGKTNELTFIQVKERNVYLVKQALLNQGSGTKQSIAKETGLSVTTCGSILNELFASNEVLLVEEASSKSIGRPAKSYKVNANFKLICCFHLTRRDSERNYYYEFHILNMNREPVAERKIDAKEHSFDEIERLLKQFIEEFPSIFIISFGISGYSVDGEWRQSWGVKHINGRDVAKDLSESLGRQVIMENDMNAISYGIYKSIYEDTNVETLVSIAFFGDANMGSGIIHNGNILEGYRHFAGEICKLPSLHKVERDENNNYLPLPYEKSLENAAMTLQTYAAIMNPEICVFIGGERVNQEFANAVLEKVAENVPRELLPKVYYVADYTQFYAIGLFHLALDIIIDAPQ